MTAPRFRDSYIDGVWRPAEARTPVFDPATGEVLAEVANASVGDCLEAADAAARVFPEWAATAPRHRAEILRRAFELMTAEAEDLARLMSAENGKVLSDARAEVAYAAEFLRWFSEEAVRIEGDYRRGPGGAHWILVSRVPVGVAVCITPWNFPAAMITRKVGPALAAGCTVVVKAASETPFTALALADLLERAGVPAGVVNVVVPEPPGEAVAALLGHPAVRKLSFTGSTRVGSLLLAEASKRVLNCSMELGGNAPFIVLEGAEVDRAVDGAMVAKLRNGGAACTAANRFLVHASLVEEFTSKLVGRFESLRVGPGSAEGTTLGPLVSAAQRDRVADLVERAVAEGARIRCGGSVSDGAAFGYEPTVLDGLDAGASILGEEIFGPVAPIVTYEDEAAMVDVANGVEMGLAGYVFGEPGRVMRIAERLEVGMIGLNQGFISEPAAPFGGMKQSGIGREGAHEGLLEFCETKYVAGNW